MINSAQADDQAWRLLPLMLDGLLAAGLGPFDRTRLQRGEGTFEPSELLRVVDAVQSLDPAHTVSALFAQTALILRRALFPHSDRNVRSEELVSVAGLSLPADCLDYIARFGGATPTRPVVPRGMACRERDVILWHVRNPSSCLSRSARLPKGVLSVACDPHRRPLRHELVLEYGTDPHGVWLIDWDRAWEAIPADQRVTQGASQLPGISALGTGATLLAHSIGEFDRNVATELTVY